MDTDSAPRTSAVGFLTTSAEPSPFSASQGHGRAIGSEPDIYETEFELHPLPSSADPPPRSVEKPKYYHPLHQLAPRLRLEEQPTSHSRGSSTFDRSHFRALRLVKRRIHKPPTTAQHEQCASRRRPPPPLIIEEASTLPSPSYPPTQANDDTPALPPTSSSMTCRPHPSEDEARTAPSPSTPREQVAPKHGLTITIPIPKDALSSRPKYRYISPTQLAHSFPLASDDFTQARERRRRAMEYSASSAGTFSVEDRKGSNTFSLPFFSPPHPPTLSIPSFAGSSERPLPPSLTNSAEFTLTVHQATPLYPGDTFSFIVEVKYPTTDLHPTLSLSFSAHSFFDSSPSDAQGGPITHHTLFNQIKRIPLPISANSSLTLPFSTTIPLGAECETCSSHYAISPPSLRVEDPGGRLRARVSYELMATWGEKVAVAEVQVAQRREIVEEALSRGVWVKLEGEKEMQGGWEGWDLERVEMSYHLPSQPPIDLLFALKSSLRLLPLHYNDPAPLLTLLSRLSTDHSHLALYEVLVGPAGPVRVTRTWDSKKSAHELQVEVNTFARRGGEGATEERGVDLRRTFKLEDVPFTSFTPASSCIGWRMEYRFELILGRLDQSHPSQSNDSLRFSFPFISSPVPVPRSEGGDDMQKNGSTLDSMVGRAWRWLARGSRRFWRTLRCTGVH